MEQKADGSLDWSNTMRASDIVREQKYGVLGKAANYVASIFRKESEPLTVARNISTNDRVAVPDKSVSKKNNDVGHLSYREQRQAYERHQEKFTNKNEGKYDSAVSHTGAVREATTGRMFNHVNSEEKMAKGYELEKRLLNKSIKENGLSPSYAKAIKPPTQSM